MVIPHTTGSVIIMVVVFVILCLIVLGICILSFYARRRYGRFLNRYLSEIQRQEIERQNAAVRPLILMEEMKDELKTVKSLNITEKKRRLEKLSEKLKMFTKLSTPKTCVICYENLSFRTPYKEFMCVLTVCGHVFHFDCIWTWLNKDESCPMCRLKSPRDEESIVALTLHELQRIYTGRDSFASLDIQDEPSCSYSMADELQGKETDSCYSEEGINNIGFNDIGMQTDSVSTSENDCQEDKLSVSADEDVEVDGTGKYVNVATSTTDFRDFEVKVYTVIVTNSTKNAPRDKNLSPESNSSLERSSNDRDIRDVAVENGIVVTDAGNAESVHTKSNNETIAETYADESDSAIDETRL